MNQLLALILGTFASEDLTTIGAGLLIRQGRLDPWLALAGCYFGIVAGDLGLWLLARCLGTAALVRLRPFDAKTSAEASGNWLVQRPWRTVFAARFLPGTRVPLYLAAGLAKTGARPVVLATLAAALIWTPLVVLAVALGGAAVERPLRWLVGPGWPSLLAVAAVCFLALRLAGQFASELGRARLVAGVSRLWRWEFWPTWVFYLPVFPFLAWLCVKHRSLTVWTAANPGIPQGGFVGESKHEILQKLPVAWTAASVLLESAPLQVRLSLALRTVAQRGWTFPVVLKPDAGQRGAGFRLARCAADIEQYLARHPQPVILQAYAPGPCEAGVFYVRHPGEAHGMIFSITDKVFPVLVGDGRRTLAELVWRHPRFRMQASTFLSRHERQRERVLAMGENFPLAAAGNHCQGTLFRDGGRLWSPDLERRIDEIAQSLPGFYCGRFDIRYRSATELRKGHGLVVVELNGVTSESTNIYDPCGSLLGAYRTLAKQWAWTFQIGAANQRQGHRPARLRELWQVAADYRRRLAVSTLAD